VSPDRSSEWRVIRPERRRMATPIRRYQIVAGDRAQVLLSRLMPTEQIVALLIAERDKLNLILKKFGACKANFWYWTQAIRSVGPIVWAWMKKAALKPVVGILAWGVRGLLPRS
jgi:hypothetical protein